MLNVIQSIKRRRLISAVKKNDLTEISKLVKNGADIGAKDGKGRSLLAIAYHYNCSNVIDFLRSIGIREEINRLHNYAKRCLNNNQLDEAKKRFEELKEYYPNDSCIFYYLGNINFKMSQIVQNKSVSDNNQDSELALSNENIAKALDLNKEDYKLDEFKLANANYILSLFYYNQQKFKEALQYSAIALENVQDHIGAKEIFRKASSHEDL